MSARPPETLLDTHVDRHAQSADGWPAHHALPTTSVALSPSDSSWTWMIYAKPSSSATSRLHYVLSMGDRCSLHHYTVTARTRLEFDLDQASSCRRHGISHPMSEIFGFDAYSSKEIAERVENVGVAKARLPLLSMVMLGMLAGVFIGLGALFHVLVVSDSTLGFAASRVLGDVVFSLGLLLVVVAGAELFTGNNLLVMAWADGKLTTWEVLRNWIVVCAANFAGALGLAAIVFLSGHADMNGGAVGKHTSASRRPRFPCHSGKHFSTA